MAYPLDDKLEFYHTYSNLRDLSSSQENLLVNLLKALSNLIKINKKLDEKSQSINSKSKQVDVYKLIENALNVNSKLVDGCIRVLQNVLFIIEEGHTR
jgi:hypothetical protein